MNDEDEPDLAQVVYGNFFAWENLMHQTEEARTPGGILSEMPHHLDQIALQMQKPCLPPHRWALFVHFGLEVGRAIKSGYLYM